MTIEGDDNLNSSCWKAMAREHQSYDVFLDAISLITQKE